jgi:acyl-coenzyme A synthetase/AMP-(fatty) acid ligase
VGWCDADELEKPVAFVVAASGHEPSAALAGELRDFVKATLAPFKCPRWIEFVDALPKTATGKIQRFRLRERARHLRGVAAPPRSSVRESERA